jgi:hypothetical protein
MQFAPESDTRAQYNGTKRRKGTKMHGALDTLGHIRFPQLVERRLIAPRGYSASKLRGNI